MTFFCFCFFQVGVAIGFLVPPVIVTDSGIVEDIGRDLSHMFYGTAGVTTALFLLCLVGKFIFKKEKENPFICIKMWHILPL